ncbi:hypothetical protein ONZ43_g6578 [Nemania bipapillata]|uniref:Uncharacterized protein n=1 Tax=Nemania bipapillata TaxID=110536 RepID=A0ACC2HYC5_9PEZI|nr:hypothetical protein ONZ43_g6578 [Nemania bipapillata]
MAEVAPTRLSGLIGSGNDNLRKASKHGDGASKKRHRESSQTEKAERKHKKSKKDTDLVDGDEAPKKKRKSHKSSKTTDSHINGLQSQDETPAIVEGDENGGNGSVIQTEKKKKHKKESKESKKSKKKKSRESRDEGLDDDIFEQPDVVVLASSRSKKFPGATSSKHQYPFYTQTVSQYLPLHPLGIAEPLEGYMNQHLEPLLNRYVPSFGGVLLAYRNPRIGESPGSGSLTQESGLDDIVVLESINEHAVNFGWLTVEIDIFRPSRGAWLEGLVNIQSGGHIGVVCWGKFNASIESERLPRDWRWVDQHLSGNDEAAPEPTSVESSPEENAEGEHAETEHTEVHVTGYWVDGEGSRVTGDTPICFRIKNYEVGTSGEYGYLSIEGTMLTEEDEQKKVHKEIEVLKRKLKQGSVLRRERRPLSELGITKFGDNDEREQESQRPEF